VAYRNALRRIVALRTNARLVEHRRIVAIRRARSGGASR
jgi:hypothetical protein